MCASKPRSASSACKNLRDQRPLRIERYCSPRKSLFGWVQTHVYYFLLSGLKFTRLLLPNTGGIAVDNVFPIVDILTSSGDVRGHILKLCKIGQNCACLWPPFLGGEDPLTLAIINFTKIPITCRSVMAIGRGSSEIS